MAISLKDLKSVKSVLPPRGLIYGPAGKGKTTLGSEFPAPVFLQVEEGTPGDLELNSFGHLQSYEKVMEALAALYAETHEFSTVVVDGIDKLEPLVWKATCEANNWDSIEAPGYGKGYIAADEYWRDFLEGLNALRKDRGMAIVLIAHSEIIRFDDPRSASYSRFDFRLHKRAHALIEDEMDMILFVNDDVSVDKEDQGFNKKRAVAKDTTQTWIYTQGRPSLNAKNRYGMPAKIIYKKGDGFKKLAPYFPGSNLPKEAEQADSEAAPATTGKKKAA
ncbi:MAG: ATP-binding protein [Xanthobacteraceae bacterium]|nr:ATP-binding protein [Xanthobacteraceae bacterium]MCW5678422.1 ATP-binding protein [Xanthobacteraceae bacterium]